MPAKQELVSFIGSTFRSVWSLELLILLRQMDPDPSNPAQLVEALRASDVIVRQSIDSLVAAGIIIEDSENRVRYQPVSDKLGTLVAATEDLYAKRPDLVRRVIISARFEGITSFADAFRIRGD